ncbi:uncharacterized protein LOC112574727 [Pomacea canaliculata]|uniref:uncharacterized protein LOC112574727 n=1 Tax=Pomacea canaliculata TaxID=400727 RepID=UPI000D739352|nr:uncharacterized protein LOC112574727 [Pomacea canaliculata]
MAIQWLRCGHHVYVVSTWRGSRAACIMLYHLLLRTGLPKTQFHLLQYDLERGKDLEKAVNDLSRMLRGGSSHVIADEVNGELQNFFDKLLAQVPRLHLWAASCYHQRAPAGWQVEHLTRPLRSPPAIVKEVQRSEVITSCFVPAYKERGVPDHTDGPPVRIVYHQGSPDFWSGNCATCCSEVAEILQSLRVHIPEKVTTTSTVGSTSSAPSLCVQWRDMIVLYGGRVRDTTDVSLVRELRQAGIPVRVMKDDDIEDVATARSDVVWVANTDRVYGLERKVVVCLKSDADLYDRLHLMSRCTSQLVIVSPLGPGHVADALLSLTDTTENELALQKMARVDVDSGSISSTKQDKKTSSTAVSSSEEEKEDLCRCLGTTDPADITGLCLCCVLDKFEKLQDPNVPEVFKVVVEGKFVALNLVECHVNALAGNIKEVLMSTAQEVLGRHSTKKQQCVTNDILDLYVEKAVNDLSQEAKGLSLYVIADKVQSECRVNYFETFCNKLLTQVPRLHLWAASCFHEDAPAFWQVEYLSRPLHCLSSVVKEVDQDKKITKHRDVQPYSERGVADHTDGPPVRRLYHRGQGHSGYFPGDCVTCGYQVACLLHSLRVGATDSGPTTSTAITSTSVGTTPPCLQWRDVLVLHWYNRNDNSGIVNGLQEAGIPVRVMKDEDIGDVAKARSDVVWVTDGRRTLDLKRKVVVCVEYPDFESVRSEFVRQYSPSCVRLDLMPLSTSQLVIVSHYSEQPEGDLL